MDALKDIIFDLENALLKPEVRASAERLNELLHDEFKEFGASGNTYLKDDILNRLPDKTPFEFSIKDFNIQCLSEYVVLATYEITMDQVKSNRSSVWVKEKSWQMVFHQGTNKGE